MLFDQYFSMVKRKRVYLPKKLKQRGIGREIDKREVIVYDFMPVLLGNEFRVDGILSSQLFRRPPVPGPMTLMEEAYTTLGKRYLDGKDLTPALECYKFALEEKIGFINFISSMQENALLSLEEINHLKLETSFEKELLIAVSGQRSQEVNLEMYDVWLDRLRKGYRLEKEYNHDNNEHCKKPDLELQLELGMWGNEILLGLEHNMNKIEDPKFKKRVRLARPKEILDVRWLKKKS